MAALGMGVPSTLRMRPSTYMYSPLPSDAMDSPFATVETFRKHSTDARNSHYDLSTHNQERLQ